MKNNLKIVHSSTKNNFIAGFTLLEALVATFILFICVSILSLSLQNYQRIREVTFKNRQLEWHLFLNQFEEEVKNTSLVKIEVEKVVFNRDNSPEKDQFFYEKYRNMLRKRTNKGAGGHQPVLMKLETIKFKKLNDFLEIKVTFTNQESYEALVKVNYMGDS
ncbi:MAG: competence type IV pilus minor pilin ComGF [Carnobacterium maltaromaticum]|uniref:competence type IV pilus minor pilin ComGF n=1 Tax=Carnobacterium maltaromaticum TaxID=2751 RepID=UPI00295F53E6|nr:competence type IV pilus minor pilin ComGF [Carnobacterium maltaromaticum]